MSRLAGIHLNAVQMNELIAEGKDLQRFSIHKFGKNLDVDTASDPEDVWEYGGTATLPDAAFTAYLATDDAADTSINITIEGLDANCDRKTVVQATDGSDGRTVTTVAGGTWRRIYRVKTSGADATVGNVYITSASNHTAGVPQDATEVMSYFSIASQITQQAIYTIPRGYNGLMSNWWVSVLKAGGKTAAMVLQQKEVDGVWRDVQGISLNNAGTSAWQHVWDTPEVFAEMTDIKLVCRTVTANDTEVEGGFDITCKKM